MKAILGCLSALAVLSSCDAPQPDAPEPSEVGRYVIIHSPQIEADTMLLDTVTGRTWQLVNAGTVKDQELLWQPVTAEPYNGPPPGRRLPPTNAAAPSSSN